MNLKIIFLDINGVLNSTSSEEVFGTRTELDSVCAGLLRKLVLATQARIVITSSWRLDHSFNELRQIFHSAGGRKLAKRVLDVTGWGKASRSKQIQDWIAVNQLKGAYVVLDDLEPPGGANWIKCDPNYGFHYPEYHQALNILNFERIDQ